jgi:hypothetical protein
MTTPGAAERQAQVEVISICAITTFDRRRLRRSDSIPIFHCRHSGEACALNLGAPGVKARDRSARRKFQMIDVGDEPAKIPLFCSVFTGR